MAQDLSEKEVYEEAEKRVKAKKRFYSHLGVYLTVNVILVIIWALSGDATNSWSGYGSPVGNMWFLYPLIGWGIFVVINFLQVFVFKTSAHQEKRAIEKEAEKLRKE